MPQFPESSRPFVLTFNILIDLFWLLWVLLAARASCVVAASGGCSLAAVFGPPVAVASLAAEPRL